MRGSGWSAQYEFWKSMSARSHVLFLAAVFFLFVPAGLLTDIPQLGANGTVRLLASSLVSGALAVAYVVVLREWPRRLPFLVAVHVAVIVWFDRIFGAPGVALLGAALHTRLVIDVNIATTSITAGFLLFSHVIRIEGTRYGRVHAEIALARDIHRLLVPAVDHRIGRFEFRGISEASGDVGGDLIDLVETPAGWTSFVADVSGHGVAAGLMMGMVKSTARAALREGASLDRVLATLNTVLFDLKSPWMYATFAGLQWQHGNLQFIVAGHLPILHYRARTSEIVELSLPQLPVAMFADATFSSGTVVCEDGDLMVILTDGLTEVFDGKDREFGLAAVKSVVLAHAQAPLARIEQAILSAVRAHGAQADDQTLLLVRSSAA